MVTVVVLILADESFEAVVMALRSIIYVMLIVMEVHSPIIK